MTAPATVNAVGYYATTRAGIAAGEATLRMKNATSGSLTMQLRHQHHLSAEFIIVRRQFRHPIH